MGLWRPLVGLRVRELPEGLEIDQHGLTYLAKGWCLSADVVTFIDNCIASGVAQFLRHSHPKISNRGRGVDYICASRTSVERWICGIDQHSPKTKSASDRIARLIVENHYRLALDRGGISWHWQSANAKNIHVAFADVGAALAACVAFADFVETGLATSYWEQRKLEIGFVTEAILEHWMQCHWATLPFGGALRLIGTQIDRMDMLAAHDPTDREVVFELKRTPQGAEVMEQLDRYVAARRAKLRIVRPDALLGAVVAQSFSEDAIAAASARTYPTALFRFIESERNIQLAQVFSNWPPGLCG